jgi:hypothetical protein
MSKHLEANRRAIEGQDSRISKERKGKVVERNKERDGHMTKVNQMIG